MSQSGLYGFNWPSAAPGALTSNMADTSSSSRPDLPGASSRSLPSGTTKTILTAVSSSDLANSAAPSQSRRTTHEKVTVIVTVTPSFTQSMTAVSEVPLETNPTASMEPAKAFELRAAALYVAGVSSEMYQTPAHPLPPSSTPLSSLPSPNPPNNGAIAGGIVGGIFGLALLVVLFRLCTSRFKDTADFEDGMSGHSRSTDDVLDEVQARRHRRRCKRTEVANARNWETGFDAEKFQQSARTADGHWDRPVSDGSSFDMAPAEMAQGYAWNGGYSPDSFLARTLGSNFPGPQYPAAMPTRNPRNPVVPQARPLMDMPSNRQSRRARSHSRSVSPLSDNGDIHSHSYGPRDYRDVSPPDSLDWSRR